MKKTRINYEEVLSYHFNRYSTSNSKTITIEKLEDISLKFDNTA